MAQRESDKGGWQCNKWTAALYIVTWLFRQQALEELGVYKLIYFQVSGGLPSQSAQVSVSCIAPIENKDMIQITVGKNMLKSRNATEFY